MIRTRKRWAVTIAAVFPIIVALQAAGSTESRSRIAETIKADVAQIVAGINAHDVDQATRFDADDIVSMESGRPASHGLAAEKEGLGQAFHYAPDWRLTLVEETVDVANSGELAVYRSTYNEDSVADGVPMTHQVNFIAEFRRQPNGQFKVAWSVVSSIEKSHKK
jgi:ketosteroid isomerase-like protein